jgi:hypothetical protein
MLRVLYGLILRAHPAYFRQRFGDEMQSIFDHAESDRVAVGLLADAMISLARQWTLRPQFWEEPGLAVAGQGAPLFSSLENNKPCTSALIYGAFLSVLVLNGVSLTMGYAWNHPRFMDIRPGYGPAGRVPDSKLISRPVPRHALAAAPSLYTDEGRVVLIFTTHAHAVAAAPDASSSVPPPTATSSQSSVQSSAPSADLLQSYAGTYISDSAGHERVNVELAGRRLQLEVLGVLSSPLTLVSNSQLLVCGGADCQVRFSANASGTVDQVEIHYAGREIHAFRVQGAIF